MYIYIYIFTCYCRLAQGSQLSTTLYFRCSLALWRRRLQKSRSLSTDGIDVRSSNARNVMPQIRKPSLVAQNAMS